MHVKRNLRGQDGIWTGESLGRQQGVIHGLQVADICPDCTWILAAESLLQGELVSARLMLCIMFYESKSVFVTPKDVREVLVHWQNDQLNAQHHEKVPLRLQGIWEHHLVYCMVGTGPEYRFPVS